MSLLKSSIISHPPIIQTKATTEIENETDPSGRKKEEFPLQYPGNKKLYIFYDAGKIIKYKYVLDESAVLRASRPSKGKAAAGTEKKRLEMVPFDFDKQNIKKIYVPVLDQHVAYLNDHPSYPVIVEGHTDYMNSDAYNQKLSERRANAVRYYLTQKGIASSRIQVAGYSEHRPIADNKTAEGRAMNRRSELEVTLEK